MYGLAGKAGDQRLGVETGIYAHYGVRDYWVVNVEVAPVLAPDLRTRLADLLD